MTAGAMAEVKPLAENNRGAVIDIGDMIIGGLARPAERRASSANAIAAATPKTLRRTFI